MRAMKKATKRMIALFLTAIMTLAMAATSFATTAEPMPAATPQKGNLIVHVNEKNTLNGQKINLYKLFSLTVSGSTDKKNYAYTVNPKYEEILKKLLNITESPVTSQTYYEKIFALKDPQSLQKFADDFTKETLTSVPVMDPEATSGKIMDATQYTFRDLERGYYLVYQTGTKKFQSSLYSVKAETNEITLKGEAPSIDKTADKETVEVGQVITYTIKGMIPDTTGYANYVYKIHDKLTNGLDFVDKQGAPVVGTEYPVSVQIGAEVASTQNAVLSELDNRTMTLDLSAWIRENQASQGQEFTITYYAKVNEDAVVQTNNSASLEYGNDPENTTTTTPDVVTTPTYPLDVNKKIKDLGTMLAGATFRLYRTELAANKAGDDAIKVTGTKGSYAVALDQSQGNMDMVTEATEVGKGYNLHLNGLAEGDYWLVETDAPAGYNKLTAPIKVTIKKSADTSVENWTVSKDDRVEADKVLDIENSTGTILPETGGMGTVLFTVIGLIMILGVAISFIRSRRTEE